MRGRLPRGRRVGQPLAANVDDRRAICEQSAIEDNDAILDAAGPETMTFEELIRTVRRAVGARSPTVHLPPCQRCHARWSRSPPYANELQRHFVAPTRRSELPATKRPVPLGVSYWWPV